MAYIVMAGLREPDRTPPPPRTRPFFFLGALARRSPFCVFGCVRNFFVPEIELDFVPEIELDFVPETELGFVPG